MQRIAPHTIPQSASGAKDTRPNVQNMQPLPPAMLLARRIRREQGAQQAKQFLIAMEPFLAPYERSSIAEQLGIRLPPGNQERPRAESSRHSSPEPEGCDPMDSPQTASKNNAQPRSQGQAGGGFSNNGALNNNMPQMLQMLSQMGGLGNMGNNGNSGGLNPMMLAQMFGNMGGFGPK